MKRFLISFLILTLMLCITVGSALAAPLDPLADPTETVATAERDQFFTWPELATYAGALVMTLVITELFKGVGFIDRIPTRIFAYAVALIVLIAATLFTSGFTLQSMVLCLFNAAVISLAANGAYDGLLSNKKIE